MLSTSANLNLRAWFCIIGNYLRRLPFFAYWRRELQLLIHARKHLISKKKANIPEIRCKAFQTLWETKVSKHFIYFL